MATRRTRQVEIDVCGQRVALNIVRDRRARCMRLSMNDRTRSFRLTLPQWVSAAEGMDFVAARQAVLARWWQGCAAAPVIAPGSLIPFLGTPHMLDWAAHHPRRITADGSVLRIGGPAELLTPRLLRWMRAQAATDLAARVHTLAAQHGLAVQRIRITDARTRWGSCTSSGTISLSWRLIMAPEAVRTYVVAHELAHLREMNHSAAFWREVERLGGDLAMRDWFRRHGSPLMLFGGGSGAV